MRLFALLVVCGCTDNAYQSGEPYIPRFEFPGPITVTEGGSTTFLLATTDFTHGNPSGVNWVASNGPLTVSPQFFELSPAYPSIDVTLTAHRAATVMDGLILYEPYIGGTVGDPGTHVHVASTEVMNVIADPWVVTTDPTGTFDVHLTQPPSAPATVTFNSTDPSAIAFSPVSLAFDASTYATPQTVTVTWNAPSGFGEQGVSLYLDDTAVEDVILVPPYGT